MQYIKFLEQQRGRPKKEKKFKIYPESRDNRFGSLYQEILAKEKKRIKSNKSILETYKHRIFKI